MLDFNLFLSKFDVWTAAILPSAQRRRDGRHARQVLHAARRFPLRGKDFVNFAYTRQRSNDKGGVSLDRTKEGYVEIIEMATFADQSTTSQIVTHVGGVPPGRTASPAMT